MFAWYQNILPRTGNFSEQFEAHGKTIAASSNELAQLVCGSPDTAVYIKTIEDEEHKADDTIWDILQDVRRYFLAPFERGAITALIGVMDYTVDKMRQTAGAVELYDVNTFTPEMVGMADIIVAASTILDLAKQALRNAKANNAEGGMKVVHIMSSAAYSLSHGLNDAQKTMGIIAVLLYSTGYLQGEFHVPHWVAISCYIAIGLGTACGGWKIIETMGTKITKLSQHQGFSASLGGSIMLFSASALGIPVSTTHTITGAVIGAGTARRASAVRWGVASNLLTAWVLTVPASAAVGASFYLITRLF